MPFSLKADVSQDVISRYPNRVFVCTGIGSLYNVFDTEFLEMYSLEKDPILVEHFHTVLPRYLGCNTIRKTKKIEVILGDYTTNLFQIIEKTSDPITFFLGSFIPNPDETNQTNTLLKELDQIKKHPIKTHTILIDYIHRVDTLLCANMATDAIIKKLLEINPLYKLTFETGGHLGKEPKAILVAHF